MNTNTFNPNRSPISYSNPSISRTKSTTKFNRTLNINQRKCITYDDDDEMSTSSIS